MPSSRLNPEGSGAVKSRYILNNLVEFGFAKAQRTRVTTAQVNAGFTLLPALPGVRWRILDIKLIAIGGAASGATSVNIIGTRAAAAVQLLAAAVAGLTQSAVGRAGAANFAVLADGASFTQLDLNTAVTIGKVGGNLATSTAVDVIIEYVADPA